MPVAVNGMLGWSAYEYKEQEWPWDITYTIEWFRDGAAYNGPTQTTTYPGVTIAFNRSIYAEGSAPRQQLNEVSAWIDASNVYGSDAERAAALRTLDGTGRLATSDGSLLPRNDAGKAVPMRPGTRSDRWR